MRALVVEDDPAIASIVIKILKAENIAVDWFSSGHKAKTAGLVNEYDLALLDLNVPELSGMELCHYFRHAGKQFPILFLTVCDDIGVKVGALDAGADDYLTKPFSLEELRARTRALLRRPQESLGSILKIADIELDTAAKTVKRKGRKVLLNRKEFGLLEFMMRNQGIVLSRASLLEHVWDMNADPFTNTIDVHISFLRSKIDSGRRFKLIQTVHGQGYKIQDGH